MKVYHLTVKVSHAFDALIRASSKEEAIRIAKAHTAALEVEAATVDFEKKVTYHRAIDDEEDELELAAHFVVDEGKLLWREKNMP